MFKALADIIKGATPDVKTGKLSHKGDYDSSSESPACTNPKRLRNMMLYDIELNIRALFIELKAHHAENKNSVKYLDALQSKVLNIIRAFVIKE